MVFLNIFWLNAFPHRLGVSQTLSPRAIITGLGVDYNKHCRIEYGQYVQMHEKDNNSMTTRTIGALALRPTGNQQGGYYFYSLSSGQRLHRTHWTELPMPAEAGDCVHALARRARAHRGLTFTYGHGNDLDALYPEDDDDADSNYDPQHDDTASEDDSDDSDFDDSDSASSDDTSQDSDDEPDDYPDLVAPPTAELTGVNQTPDELTGVNQTPNEPIDNEETPGVDDHTDLESYVKKLEAELDEEIVEIDAIDSDYNPITYPETSDIELDTTLDTIADYEADVI
jgi:hypothetical protein